MPRANIHIRNEDFDTWQGIDNKSQFIHEAIEQYLKTAGAIVGAVNKKTAELAPVVLEPVGINKGRFVRGSAIKTTQEAERSVVDLKVAPSCPNGHVLAPGTKKCSWKGCKYSK